MTIEQGRQRLAEVLETPAARQQRIKAAVKARIRQIDHELALEKIRRDGAAAVQDIRKKQVDIRRLKEQMRLDVIKWEWTTAGLANTRTYEQMRGWQDVVMAQEAITPPDEVVFLSGWRAHAEALAQSLGVSVTWEPKAAGLNAYAWPTLKRLECPPIISAASYTTVLHELGHVACPCESRHARVPLPKPDMGSVCVACEISAWTWAQDRARPLWNREMHRHFAQALSTYRRHGTAAEQADIDHRASNTGFYTAWLRSASRGEAVCQ